jgi:hypothetical protein
VLVGTVQHRGEASVALPWTAQCERHLNVTEIPRLPPPEELAQRLRLLWVLDEVRQGRMRRLRAAHLVGLGLDEFLRRASNHGLDAIDYGVEDFRSELAGAP